jgi:polyferredoxin
VSSTEPPAPLAFERVTKRFGTIRAIEELTLRVAPERQPLFVRMSDGSIQNKYTFKVLNKTDKDVYVKVTAEGGIKDQVIVDGDQSHLAVHGKASGFTVFVKAPEANLTNEVTKIQFRVENVENPTMAAEYNSMFNGPKR